MSQMNVTPVVKIMLMATEQNAGLQNAIETLCRNGAVSSNTGLVSIVVLGMGEKWNGWRHRMQLYRDEAKRAKSKSLVVCMDAYDALSVRPLNSSEDVNALVHTFELFGKPLVLSLERECGFNCVPIESWWREHGKQHNPTITTTTTTDRYVNGGLLMGYAESVHELYDWMLASDVKDDQIGLARYALAHPDRWAPDVHGKIFKNRVYGDQLTKADLEGRGCFFAHFPGMTEWAAEGYEAVVLAVLQRPSGIVSKNRRHPILFWSCVSAVILVIIAIIIVVCYWLTRFANFDRLIMLGLDQSLSLTG